MRRATRDVERRQREVNIASVPTLVVAEKYMVNMDSGRKTALEIADHLIALEITPATPSTKVHVAPENEAPEGTATID